MLSTHKSYLPVGHEGPLLLHLRFWFETKYREGSVMKVTLGKSTSIMI